MLLSNLDPMRAVCPTGTYCPEGSIEPVACPLGFLSIGSGHTNATSCLVCPAGNFCAQSGAVLALQNGSLPLCDEGFVCTGASTTPTPPDNNGLGGYACLAGTFCPRGSTHPNPCFPGTYNPSPAQGACLDCPEGLD